MDLSSVAGCAKDLGFVPVQDPAALLGVSAAAFGVQAQGGQIPVANIGCEFFLELAMQGEAEVSQVWPLTHFFLFPFCENSLICLEGKSMTHRWGNTILFHSSQQLPRLCLQPLKGFLS